MRKPAPEDLQLTLPKVSRRRVLVVVGVLAGLGILRSALVVVPAGTVGVLFNRLHGGVQSQVLREGMSLVNPVTTTVVPISIRAHTYTMSNAETEGQVRGRDGIEAKTKDGQIVNCDVTLRYAVDPTKAATLYRDVGLEFVAKLVLPTIRSAVRDAAAQYPVDVVYSEKREELARALTATISARLAPRGLVVEEFLLRNISFTPEYAQAIESKQIEQQNAFRKQYELAVAAKEADRQRIAAEGDAQANDIRGGALRADPRVIQYEYLRKVAPNVKAVVLESGEVRSESFGKR